jgi:polyhydroxybutyrate depolymerase
MKLTRFVLAGLFAAAATLLAVHHARGNSNDLRGTIKVDGRARTYELHVPTGYNSGQPIPLVLALHGRLGNGKGQARLSHFDEVSDQHGFIVVYPDGFERSWADGRGSSPSDKKGVNDVKFLSDLIDKLSLEYHIDSTRVYATGMSNGGFMSGKLACDLSNKIAAVGISAASLSDNTAANCHPEKPVSVLLMQGTADPLVPFSGGPLGKNGDRGTVLSHSDAVKKWLAIDGCSSELKKGHIPDKAGDGTSIDLRKYSTCRGGTEVDDYVINDGGHAWPGGLQYLGERWIGKTSKNMDASEVIWQFFSRHTRVAP